MITDIIYTENSIRTFTGKVFDLKILDPESICIEDIAHALSLVPRFGGHTEYHFSVAEHSLWVCERVPKDFQLQALLHDASEAYIGDMPKPFKIMMPDYNAIEDKLMCVIAKKFGFELPLSFHVKRWDKNALKHEFTYWYEGIKLADYRPSFLSPDVIEARFLRKFYELTEKEDSNG